MEQPLSTRVCGSTGFPLPAVLPGQTLVGCCQARFCEYIVNCAVCTSVTEGILPLKPVSCEIADIVFLKVQQESILIITSFKVSCPFFV